MTLESVTLDKALNAVSRLRGLGLLAYRLMLGTSETGELTGTEDAADALYEDVLSTCDELHGYLCPDSSEVKEGA